MIQITMPRLSDTMEDGVITTWLKQAGDQIEVGEVIVEIETDKAVMEFEAYDAGILTKVLVSEGERASIGTPIAELDDGRGDQSAPVSGDTSTAKYAEAEPPAPVAAAAAAPVPDTSAPPTTRNPEPEPPPQETATEATPPSARVSNPGPPSLRATPPVRALARKHGLDLNSIAGTGPGGRIIRADVESLLRPDPAENEILRTDSTGTTATDAEMDDRRDSEAVPLSNMRRIIARRLTESTQTVPHFYETAVADVEELVILRGQLNANLAATGRSKVSINDLLVRACALALREHPMVNASYRGDGADSILTHRRINVGVAVAAESGLVVPVIDNADQKTVTQIGAETKRLVSLANERKLSPAQMSGGTFTVSNLGMYGVEEFTAIINPPEGAILAVGATVREPTVVGDDVVIRHRMRYTISSDHRIIDGALAAQFLQTLTRLLEAPWTIVA